MTLQQALEKLDATFPPTKQAPKESGAASPSHPPATHRTIIELRFFGGLGLKEIGEITGLATSTVYARLQVALAFLREELKSSFGRPGDDEDS